MTAKMHVSSVDVRLRLSDDSLTAAEATDSDMMVRFVLTGLAADTAYTYQVELDGEPRGPIGHFRTLPSASAFSFMCAFAGDASTGSTASVFRRIRLADPLFFIHLGDLHYQNIATNTPALFHAAFDAVLKEGPQPQLFRDIPTVYISDDHCIGPNNANGTSASIPAACAVYRSRVPSYPLVDSLGLWHTYDVGRVRFIVTDLRSHASPNGNTDDSSKSMLGATQLAWFLNLLSNSAGMLIVWVCPRMFGGVATAGADHWGGFTTERDLIGAHVNANCPGRVIVLSADAHALAIDDGTNHTYGGESFPTFQAAPLDRTPDSAIYGGATYSEGWFNTNGQYGTMAIADSGGSTIGVTWTGFNSAGTQLVQHAFIVTV